jgi:hypothetical protein
MKLSANWKWLMKPSFIISLLTSLGQSSYHNESESIVGTLDPMMDHKLEDVW